MKIKYRILLILLTLLIALPIFDSKAAEELTLAPAGRVVGFENNIIKVNAPEAGELELTVSDGRYIVRTIRQDVPKGKSEIKWDGLAYNRERLHRVKHELTGRLTTPKGEYTATALLEINPSAQALRYALPSSDTVYLDESGTWFMEYNMVMDGNLIIKLQKEGKSDGPAVKYEKRHRGGRVDALTFSEILGKSKLEPGEYTVTAYAADQPSYKHTFQLSVKEGKAPVQEVKQTGPIMPERGDSDEEIWKKMMMPSVVVDIEPTKHQNVYESPDAHAKSLGTLHGQTQALEVKEISEGWARIAAWDHEAGRPVEGWVPLNDLKVVYPQKRYGLLLDKQKQNLTLFDNGKRIDTLAVSTGWMEKNKCYQETSAGSFLTDLHMQDYSTNGKSFDSVIRYDGGNLLHQTPYGWKDNIKNFSVSLPYLGAKASNGCVRIQAVPAENGTNAYWLWTHLPYHTRIIILDDPAERGDQERLATGTMPEYKKARTEIVEDEEDDGNTDEVTILFGGDAAAGVRETYWDMVSALPAYLKKNGTEYPFSGLKKYFDASDAVIVNLECVLKENGEGEAGDKLYRFRGLPEYVKILTDAGITAVNIANNHTIDYGEAGMQSTKEILDKAKLPYFGNERNIVLEIGGHKFGFGGCRETNYLLDPDIVRRDIAELRKKGAEVVVYSCHWGKEYANRHNMLQEAMASACANAGADLVIGHHPHVVQGIGRKGGTLVVYSLGNLMFGGTIKLDTFDALLAQVTFRFRDGRLKQIVMRPIPILTSSLSGRKVNDYHPVPAEDNAYDRIMKKVQNDSGMELSERIVLNIPDIEAA